MCAQCFGVSQSTAVEAAPPSSAHTHVRTHANTALKAAGIVSELETHPAFDLNFPALQEAGICTPSGRWLKEPVEISPQRCVPADTEYASFSIFTENQQTHAPNLRNNFSLNNQATWLHDKHTTCEISGPSVCLWTEEQELKPSLPRVTGGRPSAPPLSPGHSAQQASSQETA